MWRTHPCCDSITFCATCFRSPGLSSGTPLHYSWHFIMMIAVIKQHSQFNDLAMAWKKVGSAPGRAKGFLSSPQRPDQSGAHPASFSVHTEISPFQWRTQEFCSGAPPRPPPQRNLLNPPRVQQIQLRTERTGIWGGGGGGSPLVRGSGGSCNLVQEISFHTVKFS
jgi:hypothetical protein